MDAAANAAKDLIEKSQKNPTNPHSFTPQGISNIVWTMATVAVSSQKPLLDAFSASLEFQNLKTWKAQELSNSAWSFATLLVMDEMVLDTISEMALQQLEHFGFRHSANLVWALATLEKTQEPLMQAIAQTAAANAYELSPLSLASTAWACMSMSIICFPLLDVMAKILFRSPVDDGIATMAIWTLSRLPDLDLAFQLVHSAQWRIPPLSLSALLEACEQLDISQLRVLRLLAHGHLKPAVLDLLDTMEVSSSDRTVKSSDGSLEPWDLSEKRPQVWRNATDDFKMPHWWPARFLQALPFFNPCLRSKMEWQCNLYVRHDILESFWLICNFHGAFSIATWILCPHVVRPRFGQGPTQWGRSHQRCCAQRILEHWRKFDPFHVQLVAI